MLVNDNWLNPFSGVASQGCSGSSSGQEYLQQLALRAGFGKDVLLFCILGRKQAINNMVARGEVGRKIASQVRVRNSKMLSVKCLDPRFLSFS